jgi:beta-mannosidase
MLTFGDLQQKTQRFTIPPNQSSELVKIECPPEVEETSYIILAATVHDSKSGEELSRHFSWPEPYRYLYAAATSKVDVDVGDKTVRVTCGKYPVKGLLLYVDPTDGENVDWADNMYDLMPGESIALPVEGLEGRNVQTKWLYSWENS